MYCKRKTYFGFYFLVRVSKNPDSVSLNCSFSISRYSPVGKPSSRTLLFYYRLYYLKTFDSTVTIFEEKEEVRSGIHHIINNNNNNNSNIDL